KPKAAAAFSDVPSGYWAAEAIAGAAETGLMTGYPDGSFKPKQHITRAEMASLAAQLSKRSDVSGEGFTDVAAGHWALSAILQAQGAGILNGYTDGTFRPGKALTRAEAVTAVNRALGRGPLFGAEASPWSDVPLTHWAFADILEASTAHAYKAKAGGGEEMSN
ncbi:S-layer homology domain-containing protein, partial [Paenibacillus sonchi]